MTYENITDALTASDGPILAVAYNELNSKAAIAYRDGSYLVLHGVTRLQWTSFHLMGLLGHSKNTLLDAARCVFFGHVERSVPHSLPAPQN